jgi:hypothetical protein
LDPTMPVERREPSNRRITTGLVFTLMNFDSQNR